MPTTPCDSFKRDFQGFYGNLRDVLNALWPYLCATLRLMCLPGLLPKSHTKLERTQSQGKPKSIFSWIAKHKCHDHALLVLVARNGVPNMWHWWTSARRCTKSSEQLKQIEKARALALVRSSAQLHSFLLLSFRIKTLTGVVYNWTNVWLAKSAHSDTF